MKTHLLLLATFLWFSAAHAQLNESVDFNTYQSLTDNDLVNKFSGVHFLWQETTGGITGGAVRIDDWEDDVVKYNHRFSTDGKATTVSLCFKYQAALMMSIYGSPIELQISYDSISPLIGVQHCVSKFYTDMGVLNFSSNCVGSAHGESLTGFHYTDGNWYRLEAKIVPVTGTQNQYISAALWDLGATGTSAPTLVDDIAPLLCGNDLNGRQDVTAAFHLNSGTGTDRVDNFRVTQQAASDIPSVAGGARVVTVPSILTGDVLPVSTDAAGMVSFSFCGINGAQIMQGQFLKHTNIDCADLPAGMYLLRVYGEGAVTVRKITKL